MATLNIQAGGSHEAAECENNLVALRPGPHQKVSLRNILLCISVSLTNISPLRGGMGETG
jgi:hypothetical protein